MKWLKINSLRVPHITVQYILVQIQFLKNSCYFGKFPIRLRAVLQKYCIELELRAHNIIAREWNSRARSGSLVPTDEFDSSSGMKSSEYCCTGTVLYSTRTAVVEEEVN